MSIQGRADRSAAAPPKQASMHLCLWGSGGQPRLTVVETPRAFDGRARGSALGLRADQARISAMIAVLCPELRLLRSQNLLPDHA